jgi:hypothetical protein
MERLRPIPILRALALLIVSAVFAAVADRDDALSTLTPAARARAARMRGTRTAFPLTARFIATQAGLDLAILRAYLLGERDGAASNPPLVADTASGLVILNGHHRYAAARLLGRSTWDAYLVN